MDRDLRIQGTITLWTFSFVIKWLASNETIGNIIGLVKISQMHHHMRFFNHVHY
ncbi:protein of unknown function [Nitrosotalea devaniterrae]|uniref:Uncharacterized protein n=1 Tax=Nitrosotalea devaniterrae TaxID=1078905 RepID=A0A128A431_9ARCH|nr:protein of unknown function [Candidatus Nitrosotalea devanaterra]